MTTHTTEPRLYVGTYAKYNSGSLRGAWMSLEGHDKESFYAACAELHKDEADPEYMFQISRDSPASFTARADAPPSFGIGSPSMNRTANFSPAIATP